MKDFTGTQLTLVCFIAILCLNILICKGYHRVGSKSIVRERVFKSLFYNANFINLEKVEAYAPTSNIRRTRSLSTSLSMSPSDDGIGKKNGESDSESDDEGDEAEDEEEEGNIAEILMAQAAKDMDEKKMKDLFDAQLKKKLILKKKSDKEYEAYWSKQKGKEKGPSDAAVYRAYYSLKKNETLDQKLGGDGIIGADSTLQGADANNPEGSVTKENDLSSMRAKALLIAGGKEPVAETWDYSVKPITGNELSTTGIGFAALFVSVFVAKKISNGNKMETFSFPFGTQSGGGAYFASRNVKKEFTYEELVKSAGKAYTTEGYNALPDVPNSLLTLPSLAGNPKILAENFASSSNSKVTAVVYWRPSDALSVRAVIILENLQKAFPQFFSVVSILAPRYPSERILGISEKEEEGKEGKERNVLESLLIPGEKPTNILLDANLETFRDLTVHHWPTVFICLKKGTDVVDGNNNNNGKGTTGGENKAKIIFALESQRAVSGMVSKSISAVLSVIQYSEEKTQALIDAEKSGDGIKTNQASEGMWGRNFDAIYTGTPLTPYVVTAKKEQLSRPMRLTVNNKNGLLYIADTGNHRVLEVDVSQSTGVVKRVFGSASGISGPAADGTTIDKMLLNRPMGVAVDVDGILYIADSGNDAIRRIQLGGKEVGGGTVVTVSVAPPNVDADGSVYDVAEISQIERTLGKNLMKMRDTTADELYSQLSANKMLDDPLASQLLGRTRPLLIPTDVAISDAFVYASAAGSRQIWRVTDNGFTARPVFGSGVLGSTDYQASLVTSFLGDTLRFDQPAGIVGSSGRLFVVDSEACTLRGLNLIEGYTKTVLGQDGQGVAENQLLEGYGDIDTGGTKARTQGPTGSCLLDTDKLLICDTLNNKIKCVEIDGTRSAYSRSFIGSGKRGKKLVEENSVDTGDKKKKEKENKEELLKTISLDSPQGVAYDRSKKTIYIADTGNDRILRVNRETYEITEIKLDFTSIRK